MQDILLLGIETSCDETAAAVVKNGREVLSNVISSQVALHAEFGGVVPEIASRNHLEKIDEVIRLAVKEAGIDFSDLSGISVTVGPGLVGGFRYDGTGACRSIACRCFRGKSPILRS